ncbi:MAG TPA: hypothetical protein VE398_16510 [Acidobacteriota bacterium]|nr:hypothetical protein [Acidobacteriota bacterium]
MIRKAWLLVASILASAVSFFLTYGMVQYYLTRNLPGDAFSMPKLCLNFTVASFVGGVIYAIIRRDGSRWLAIIPSLLLGSVSLVPGGIEPLPLVFPVLTGAGSGLLGAYIAHKIASRGHNTRFLFS